jgi:hypothetical protein
LHKALQVHSASLHSPPRAVLFSLAVLRHSETEGTRLVGYVEMGRDKILGSVETNSCSRCSPLTLSIVTEDYNVAFELELKKVNPDGPSLRFNAGFSVSELPYPGVSGLALVGMADNKCKTTQMVPDHQLSYPQLPLLRVTGSKMSFGRCMKTSGRPNFLRCRSFQ